MNEMPFHVLIIDDDPDDIKLAEIQLSKVSMDVSIDSVGSRKAFLEYLNREPLPDLVICDYQLPKYNGEKALNKIRELHSYLPFILVTGYLDEEGAVELMRKGASDIITKQKLDRLGPAVQRELINFSERRENQRELEIAHKRFQSLVEQGGDVVAVLGEKGYPEYISPSVENIFGYSVEKAMSISVNEITHPDDYHYVEKALKQAKRTSGKNIPVPPVRMKHQDQTWRWCKTSLTDLRHQPSVSGIVYNIRDIHEQVLNARNNQLMLNNTEDNFIYINRELIIQSFNDRFAKNYKDVFGFEVKRGDSILKYVQPERREIVKDTYDRVMEGETVERDLSFETKDGTTRYFHVKYKPGRDENENIIGSFISLIEITDEKKAKLELEKNEARFRALVENGSDILFILNSEGQTKYISPSIKNVLGYTAEEAMQINMMNNAHPDDVEMIMDEIKKCLDQPGVPLKVPPARLKDKDGDWHWFEGTITNMLHDPAIEGIVDNFHEITDRVEAEQKTAEAKNQYQSLIQTVDGIVWEADAETLVFNYVSPQAEKILGYSPDDWIGKKDFWQKRVHPEDRERVVSFCSRQTYKGVNHVIEYRMKKADGDYIWLRDVVTVVNDQGKAVALRGLMIDIDQEKELEIKLEQAYQLAKIGNWELDLVNEKLYWSNYVKGLHEVDDDYEPNLDTAIGFYKEGWSRDTILSAVEHSIKTGEPFDHELEIETAKGNERWVRTVGRPEFVNDTCVRVFGSTQDITERKIAQIEQRKAEEKYRNVVEHSTNMFYQHDTNGVITYVSPQSKQFLGYTPEEAKRSWTEFITNHPLNKKGEKITQRAIDTGEIQEPYELQLKTAHNRIIWVEVNEAPLVKDGKVKGIVGSLTDITDRKQFEEQLKASIERYEYVTQATSDAIWEFVPATGRLFWGQGFKTLFGYDKIGYDEDFGKWISQIHPEDISKIRSGVQELLEGGESNWNEEYRFKKTDGTYAYVQDKAIVIRDEVGNTERVVGAMEDITERKEKERELKLMESVVTNTTDAILITKAEPFDAPNGPEIVYVNKAFEKMTGYSFDEVVGKTPRILQGPNSDFKALKEFGKKIRRWEQAEVETINYKKNGEEFWINFSVTPLANETGWYTHWISVERDVTDRKNRELKQGLISDIGRVFNSTESLRESLEKVLCEIQKLGDFQLGEIWLVNHNKDSIDLAASLKDQTEQFYEFDNGMESFKKGEGLPGVTWQERDIQFWKNLDKREDFLRNQSAKEASIKTAYGLPIIYDQKFAGVLLLGVKDTPDKPHYFAPILKEIAEHLGDEIHRKRLEEELSRIFASAPDGIIVAGFDGYFKKVNPAMSEILEYSEEELLETPFIEFVHPEDREATLRMYDEVNSGNEKFYFENRYITKSGNVVWLSWTFKVFLEEEVAYSVAKNITDQKRLEKLLDQANVLSKIGSWEVDLIKNETYWSDITREILGVGAEVEPSMEIGLDIFKEGENRDIVNDAVAQAIERGTPWDIEVQIEIEPGRNKWVRSIGEAEFIEDKCVRLYGSIQDIHEKKELEELLAQSNRLAKIGSWEVNLVSEKLFWSEITREIHEVKPEFNPTLETAINFYKDGESKSKITEAINHAIETGEGWEMELQIVTAKGNERWVKVIGETDVIDGECVRIYGSFQDIHDMKIAETRLENIADNLPGVLFQYWLTPDGQDSVHYLSVGSVEVWGVSAEDAMEDFDRVWAGAHSEDVEGIRESIVKSAKSLNQWHYIWRYSHPDGSLRWQEGFGTPQKLADGTVVWDSIVLDITERKELEELLKQANRLAKIGSWGLDFQENKGLMYWSDMTREILEVDEDYSASMERMLDFYNPKSKKRAEKVVKKLVENAEPFDLELLITTQKGNEKWIRSIGKAELVNGNITRIYGSYQDIHQRKSAEIALQEAFDEKNEILESIGDAFFAVDENWIVTYWNHKAEEVLGMSREDIVGENLWDLYEDATTLDFYSQYHKSVNEQVIVHFEEFYPTLEKWFDVSAYPSESGLSIYFKDITERKKAQKQLIERTKQLDAIAMFNSMLIKEDSWEEALEKSFPAIGELVNCDRVYYFKNVSSSDGKQTVSMTQEWVKEGISSQIDNPQHHNVPHDEIRIFVESLINGKSFNYTVKDIKDKEFRELLKSQDVKSLLALPVFTGNIFRGFIGFDDCKTERTWREEEISFLKTIAINLASAIENEDAENAIQKAYKEKNEILESIGDGFFTLDKDFTVTYWNQMAEELLHTSKEKVLRKNLWDVFDKEQASESYSQYKKAIQNQVALKFEDYYEPIDSWFDVNVYPSQQGISVFFKDITDRKKADEKLKELNKALEQQARELATSNAELEQFAFVASHDLQEPLRMITGFLAQLEKKYDHLLDEKGKKYIHFATDGAKRMREIILDLLEFSRVGRVDIEREKIELNKLIKEVQSLNKKLITETKAEIHADDLPVIYAAHGQMRQLFQNLINNAIKYQEKGKKPIVHIDWNEDETYWFFSIRDNGIGFNEEYKEKIFHIFQRLHGRDEYSGSGMGLAICKKIVEDHGGEILAESEEGVGSIFKFAIAKEQRVFEDEK